MPPREPARPTIRSSLLNRIRRLHFVAIAAGMLAGGVIAVSLVNPGASAQDPAVDQTLPAALTAGGVPQRLAALFEGDGAKGPAGHAETAEPQDTRPSETRRRITIESGDTLMNVMLKAGASRPAAYDAVTAIGEIYDPRKVRPGQELTLVFSPPKDEDDGNSLSKVVFHTSVSDEVVARLGDDGFSAETVERPLETRDERAAGRINDSLFLSAERAGLPVPVILELIKLYSFDVDFQRDIQPGDSFEVLFQTRYTEDGQVADYGNIVFARLHVGGTDLPLYRFEMSDGTVDYFNDKGASIRKALMKTPIDGARISSGYGMRKHPILGYTRMHKGIDFAAPTGTPIVAAGDGTIEMARRNGGYGNFIKIRHNSDYETGYGHMSRFAKGIRAGVRVRQGQVIGYVGSTGRSTGPHLHFEVLRDRSQINPTTMKLPSGRKLRKAELARFMKTRAATRSLLASTPLLVNVAANSSKD